MEPIRVDKAHLIGILEINKRDHKETVRAAQRVFREQVIARLEDALTKAANGKLITRDILVIALPIPEDHTDDYERAIRMLNLSLDDEVRLTEQDHRRYVLDEWEWQNTFTASTMSYLSE